MFTKKLEENIEVLIRFNLLEVQKYSKIILPFLEVRVFDLDIAFQGGSISLFAISL